MQLIKAVFDSDSLQSLPHILVILYVTRMIKKRMPLYEIMIFLLFVFATHLGNIIFCGKNSFAVEGIYSTLIFALVLFVAYAIVWVKKKK
mgnify:CR=1 FL=1